MGRINRTLLYGEGLFETLRVYPGRRIPLLEAHCRRMAHGAEFFGFPFSSTDFARAVTDELRKIPEDGEARLRITLEVWGDGGPEETRFLVHLAPLMRANERAQEAVRLTRAPFARSSSSPLLAFKTTNYFENRYARQWARQRGYDDAVFFNEHEQVTETTTANLFLVRGRRLITPPVSAGLLPGVARRLVLASAADTGLSAEESDVTIADLASADEVMVSNAVVELLPVKDIAGIFTGHAPFDWAVALHLAYRKALGLVQTADS